LQWDGTTEKGKAVSDGVYTWVIYYTPTSGNRQSAHGFITVLK
jgi:flagellar hook assembly protein FlgD